MGEKDIRDVPNSDLIKVSSGSLIFPRARIHSYVEEGASIADMLLLLDIPDFYKAHLIPYLNDEPIPVEWWTRVRPKPGTRVDFLLLPQGSGPSLIGNDTLRMAASVLVTLGGALAPLTMGISGVGASLLTAGLSFAGMFAVNALIPPPKTPEDPKGNTISGVRNRITEDAPIPKVFGKMRVVPPLCAQPFYEVEKNEQFVNMLYLVGWGPVDITDIRIGNTPITDYEDVELEIFNGRTIDGPRTLFKSAITSDNFSALLEHAESVGPPFTPSLFDVLDTTVDPGGGGYSALIENHPNVVERESDSGAESLEVQITFPQGLYRQYDNGPQSWRVDIHVQYKPVGAGHDAWVDVIEPLDNERRDFADGLTETRIWEWLEGLVDSLDDLLDDIESFSGVDRIAATAFITWLQALLTDIEERAPDLSTADGDGEAPGWRDGIMTALLGTTLPRASALIDDFIAVVSEELQTAFQAKIDEFVDQFGPLGALIEVQRYMELGYGPEIHTFPPLVRFMIIRQGLEPIFGEPDLGAQAITDNDAAPVRRKIRWDVDIPGRYKVRVRRASPDSGQSSPNRDKMYWTSLKTIRETVDPMPVDGLAYIALRMKATDQIFGQVDTLSCQAETLLRTWDQGAGDWVDIEDDIEAARAAGRNPAWAYVDALTSIKGGVGTVDVATEPEAIDWDRIEDWAAFCTFTADAGAPSGLVPLTGFHYDEYCTRTKTIERRLDDICGAGRASRTQRDGKFSVIIDEIQTETGQLFSAREIIKGSLQISGAIGERPVALRCLYTNADNDYARDEWIVYDDGFDEDNTPADRIETVELTGVVDAPATMLDASASPNHTGQVHRLARYMIASARLRPKQIRIDIPLVHLRNERGDLCRFQSPFALIGDGASRIVSITRNGSDEITGIVLEEEVYLPAGETYRARVRTSASAPHYFDIDVVDPLSLTLVPSTPYADASAILAGDLIVWGIADAETIPVIIREIAYKGLVATVVLVDYNESIYTAEVDTIAPWQTFTRYPIEDIVRPPAPVISTPITDEGAILQLPGGILQSRILLPISAPAATTAAEELAITVIDKVEIQFRETESSALLLAETDTSRFGEFGGEAGKQDWFRLPLFSESLSLVPISPVEDGKSYDLRVRFISKSGTVGEWANEAAVFVVGKSAPPPDVRTIYVENRLRTIRWDYPEAPVDLRGFYVRFGDEGVTWDAAAQAHEGILPERFLIFEGFNGGDRDLLVKAVDTTGNESVNAKRTTVSYGDLAFNNIITTYDQAANNWQGTKRGAEVNGSGFLEATIQGAAKFWGEPGNLFWGDPGDLFWAPSTYNTLVYEVAIAVTELDSPGIITTEVTATGNYVVEYWRDVDAELWPDDLDNEDVWPDDMDAAYWPGGVGFKPFPGEVQGEAGNYRFRVTISGGATQGVLEVFNINIDVADIEETISDIEIDYNAGAGERLVLTKTFRVIKAISWGAQPDGGPRNANRLDIGDKNVTLGPQVIPYDDATGADGTFDIIVKGY